MGEEKQLAAVQVDAGEHRVTLTEHLIERHAGDRWERHVAIEHLRLLLRLDDHPLDVAVTDLAAGLKQRDLLLDGADGIGRGRGQGDNGAVQLFDSDPNHGDDVRLQALGDQELQRGAGPFDSEEM